MPALNLMLKPASSACNLRCAYCFYADEARNRRVSDYGIMPWPVAQSVIDKAMEAAEGAVSFLFQGGEPVLAGMDFYRRFTEYAESRRPEGLAVQYAIQTNGTLLDQEWCTFFAENHYLVGLSLDGDMDCHDRFRRDGAGKGSFERVMNAARLLEQSGVEYNVLTVVTGYLAERIDSVFPALCKGGFHFQQYIPCLDPLGEERGKRDYSLSPAGYEAFLKKLFDLWYGELEQGRYWSVRYFDNLVWMLMGNCPAQCSMVGRCMPQYLVEADGSVYPCDFYGLDEYRLGNICKDSWQELDRERARTGFAEASAQVPAACGACRWYGLCRNGCRRERLPEGEQPGRNYYCQAYVGFFEYAWPRLRYSMGLIPSALRKH